MYKLIGNSQMPKFLKVLLYILLTLTCVYWIGWFTYQILELVRKAINIVTVEKGRWWFFLMCLCILCASLCIAFKYNPFLELWEFITMMWKSFREGLGGIIAGK